jgi:hypothetical protein
MPIKLRIDDLLETLEKVEGFPPNRTRYWLACQPGLSHSAVYKYAGESGTGVPRTSGITWDMLERFCRILHCKPGDLIALSD